MQICEMYKSIQGEGIRLGRPSFFIRTAGCNLRCRYCPTKYHAQDPREIPEGEVARIAKDSGLLDIVITGGEPMMQPESILAVAKFLELKHRVHLETNGTISLSPAESGMFNTIGVSPKLPSSGATHDLEELLSVWSSLARNVFGNTKIHFRFVVTGEEDRKILEALIIKMGMDLWATPLVLQPNTQDPGWEGSYKETIKWATEELSWDGPFDLRLMPRWQTILWPGERQR